MRSTSVFFLTCIFLCATFSTKVLSAQDSNPEFEAAFHVADSLMHAADFELAALAYENIYFQAGDFATRFRANISKSQALKMQGRFSDAARELARSLVGLRSNELIREVLYEMALCRYLAADFAGARSEMLQIKAYAGNTSLKPEYYLLFSLIETKNNNKEQARDYAVLFSNALDASPECKNAMEEEIKLLFESDFPKLRNPEKAGRWATFLPGTGHLYAGYPGWGILNGGLQLSGLALAAYLAFNHYYFSAFILGLGTFQMFYFGGIRHAERMTAKRNKKLEDAFLLHLTELLSGFQSQPCITH